MKTRNKRAATSATVLALATTIVLGSAGAALAATPPFEPTTDPNAIGSLSFFDASGTPVIGGTITDTPFAAYVQTSGPGRTGDTKATLFGYLPKNGIDPGAWSGEQLSQSTTYPNAGAPAALAGSPLPLVTPAVADLRLADLLADYPNTATDAYKGLYQLRVKTSGVGQPAGASYFSADILVTGTHWDLVYPAPVPTSTTTGLGAAPASPQQAGTTVTLTATVTPSGAAGTVQFKDGAAALGSPVTVTSGSAALPTSALAVGSHSLTAVFTPTNSGLYAGSTSAAIPYTITAAPAGATATALSVSPTAAPAFSPVALHADVTRTSNGTATGAGSGSVQFKDGGVSLGAAVPLTATGADLTYSSFAVGAHDITAQFVPANAAVLASSASPQVTFTASTPTSLPAVQNVTTSVPAGTLTITTPYGTGGVGAAPFDLGPLTLDAENSVFSTTRPFGSVADPAAGVTITDTRAGDLPWTASVTATDFTDGGTGVIDATGLSFTSVSPQYIVPDALDGSPGKSVVTTAVTSVKGGPHQLATAAHGLGAVHIVGTLGLTAPASTPAGLYTATLTFTIA